MRDHILESIFLDIDLWKQVIEHGLDKRISKSLLESIADPHKRADLCIQIAEGKYIIQPPHTGYRKKDDGSERMFLANEPQDRLLLNVIYKWLMKNEAKMIHPSCRSYQSGIGIGKIVKQISSKICTLTSAARTSIIGRKFDIQKYFESIDRNNILNILKKIENDFGSSSILDLLTGYYNSDVYYNTRKKTFVEEYQGIKQGCAVSAWLANVLLYEMDKDISQREGLYVRYSDDILYIGNDYEEVTDLIEKHLSKLGLTLNAKKIEDIRANEYFRFLGFEIKGPEITLSRKWVKNFQKEIDKRTIKNTELIKKARRIRRLAGEYKEKRLFIILNHAIRDVNQFLLYGNGKYSWANEVLPTINNRKDILTLSVYCLDALRAVYTGHTNIGGLGKSMRHTIQRGKGKNVLSNRKATRHLNSGYFEFGQFNNFISLNSLKNIISNKWLYRALAYDKKRTDNKMFGIKMLSELNSIAPIHIISELEDCYARYRDSQPNGKECGIFYAKSLDDMTAVDLIKGENRYESLSQLYAYLIEKVNFSLLTTNDKHWYWQSQNHPQLVLLKKWFVN